MSGKRSRLHGTARDFPRTARLNPIRGSNGEPDATRRSI